MNFTNNKIITLSIAIIFVIFFTSSVVFFLIDKIENKTEKLQEQKSMLKVLQQQNDNFLELKKTYNIVEENQKKIESILPDDNTIENFIIKLEQIAEQTNNSQSLNFEPLENAKTAGGNVKSLKFTVLLTGNLNTFIKYLNQVKSSSYFVEIENITIINSLGISNNNSKINIKAKTYIRN